MAKLNLSRRPSRIYYTRSLFFHCSSTFSSSAHIHTNPFQMRALPVSVLYSAPSIIPIWVILSILLSGCIAVSNDARCYTGNGTVSADLPCNLGQDISFCCGVGWSCLSNGLCQYRDSTSFAEGTCTDKTFPANSCLGICLAST